MNVPSREAIINDKKFSCILEERTEANRSSFLSISMGLVRS